ncbi:MAG: glycosyltransferase family 2 protein [Candidatus Latescibacteria bacterium]|nr:glycosyltransferase family 2 protein [Candidatus Latescibacterota bacterium]
MQTDLITIGITCFNAEATIERAVRSARGQTWPAIEIVVVDDASTDASWTVVQRLASEDARVHAFRQAANRGVGATRNSVLAHASGDFVAFFDDDDVSAPERLSEQHRRIVAYERATSASAVACYSATEQRYPDGTTVYSPALGADATPGPSGDEVARLILLGKPTSGSRGVCPTSSLLARRRVYDLVGGFDSELRRHEDTDFNLRLALRGGHFAGVSNALVIQSMTFTSDKAVSAERQSALRLIEKHRDVLQRWKWYDFSRLWTEMKFARFEGGVRVALPYLIRLALTSPAKTARKVMWSLPNRKTYQRYKYSHESRV